MKRRQVLAVSLLAGCAGGPAAAEAPTDAPFYLRSQNPFLQLYGVPAPEGGQLTPSGSIRSRLSFSLANHADAVADGAESAVFDGESYYTDAVFRVGLGERWEIGLDVPLVAHGDGVLDNVIEGWHDLVGLSNDARQGPSNRLHLAYAGAGVEPVDITDGSSGIGDIRLSAAYSLRAGDRAVAVRGLVKLPSGDADELHGSGAADVAVALELTDRRTLADWSITLFGQAGVMRAGDGDVLAPLQEQVVPFGSAGLAWRWTEALSLRMQVSAQGEQFDSGLYPLGDPAVNLTLGGTWVWQRLGLELDLALVEDVVTDPTPDFGMYLSIARRSGLGS